MKKLLLLGAALFAAPTYGQSIGQPCAPLYNILNGPLKNTPCGDLAPASEFIITGYRYNLDPRIAAAIAKYETNGGLTGVCRLVNDPFAYLPPCDPHNSFSATITSFTHDLVIRTSSKNIKNIISAAGLLETQQQNSVIAFFEDMGGQADKLANYSFSCCGDCNFDRTVMVNEIVYLANWYTTYPGDAHEGEVIPIPPDCRRGDSNADDDLTIGDFITDINNYHTGCPKP